MPIESHSIRLEGREILAVLDDDTARDIVVTAGLVAHPIPAGCNTVTMHFRTGEGRAALYVNQRGFAPTAGDDEQQVNGSMVLILQSLPAPSDAQEFLSRALKVFENSPPPP